MFHFPGASFRREDKKKSLVLFKRQNTKCFECSVFLFATRSPSHHGRATCLLLTSTSTFPSLASVKFRVLSCPHRAKDGATLVDSALPLGNMWVLSREMSADDLKCSWLGQGFGVLLSPESVDANVLMRALLEESDPSPGTRPKASGRAA